jgi:hypothetical protein
MSLKCRRGFPARVVSEKATPNNSLMLTRLAGEKGRRIACRLVGA